MQDKKFSTNQAGAAALVTVLIVCASILVVVASISLSSLAAYESAEIMEGGDIAYYCAINCLEEGLARSKINSEYNSNNLLMAMEKGSCRLSVSGSGTEKIIQAEGIFNNYHKYITSEAHIASGTISLLSWNEN